MEVLTFSDSLESKYRRIGTVAKDQHTFRF